MDRGRILHAVIPLDTGTARVGIEEITGEHHDRNPITPGVVNRHRRMLKPDGAVRNDAHRLARRLGVTMRHRHRRFLVGAGKKLGFLVATVINDGFLQAAKARSRIGRDVFHAGRLDDVDHVVRTRPVDDLIPGLRLFSRLRVRLGGLRRCVRRCQLSAEDGSSARRRALQKCPTIESIFAHDVPHRLDFELTGCEFFWRRFLRTGAWLLAHGADSN